MLIIVSLNVCFCAITTWSMQFLESAFLPALLKNVCVSDKALQVCVELNRLGIGALPVKLLKQVVRGLEDVEYTVKGDFV